MNNKYLVGALIFVAGVAVGAGVTYFAVRNKAQKYADDQIEDMRRYVDKKLKPFKTAETMNEKAEKAEEEALSNDTQADFGEEYIDYTQIARDYQTATKVDYANMGTIDEVLKASIEHPTDEISGPKIITFDEFTDPLPNYDKVLLRVDTNTYRVFDELTDEEEDFDILGDVNVDEFVRSDEDVMYVRNDKLGVDYEVTKYEGDLE